jgi:hypothetical protein
MYSFFRWGSTGASAPADPIEQRAIVVVQLVY